MNTFLISLFKNQELRIKSQEPRARRQEQEFFKKQAGACKNRFGRGRTQTEPESQELYIINVLILDSWLLFL